MRSNPVQRRGRRGGMRRGVAIAGAFALLATACAVDDDDEPDDTSTDVAEGTEDAEGTDDGAAGEDGDDGAAGDVNVDVGVTEEPCPEAVNPDNGCIYLGVLSDLSEGPFAALGIPLTAGQEAFWQRVNDEGGIGGYDVDISTYTRDTLYDPQEHSARYREIEPNILALAQTLGTEPTEAILPDMDADNVIGAPATWWSGWAFEDNDFGLILESGYSYCLESQIGLDWAGENVAPPSTVLAVGYPGDYGGDSAAGVEAWAMANDAEFGGFVETAPDAVVGSQDAAIGQVVGSGADVVVLAVGPAEAASIVGGSLAEGYEGLFLGSVPTWDPALLDSPAGEAMVAAYRHIAPWEGIDGETPAHEAIRESLGDDLPANEGYIFGWVWSYPIKAALEAAVENGDLTRAGVRAAVDGLEVDYEGILPSATFGGEANETAVRTAVINQPDPEGSLGVSPLQVGVTGATADAYEYTAACA
ncbi:ABC transporter substrate-binding protein [Phytoactinopolyspora halotolerans]|uniref:ABC transporter substrate-binding protein n=1 Tax=Phytoactinopolyspora halotolerans TaxID=1981512 RepID=A0A6L9SCU2_9ACTN|nr:ABC transporter substrate-binding protein [Phytoactinopolyspora halotolerans]NEE02361.1 ABC transporter substrate-binding protein [Phytoactinopolyspora halotolerans]